LNLLKIIFNYLFFIFLFFLKYIDLDNLKDKWGGKISDQGVKDRIRLILVRKMLGDI
jgi:hypothetical protein